jgi:hypothetical protein
MGTEIDKKQIEAEWKEFCETGELPETKPRVIKEIVLADFDTWTIGIIGKDGDAPATTKHYVNYILLYLRCGNGLFIKRFASVLMRLFTRSLKPSQVFSSRQN